MLHGVGLYRTLVHWFDVRPHLIHKCGFVHNNTADPTALCRADACFWFSSLFVVPILVCGGVALFVCARTLSLAVAIIFAAANFLISMALGVRLVWQRFAFDALDFKHGVLCMRIHWFSKEKEN